MARNHRSSRMALPYLLRIMLLFTNLTEGQSGIGEQGDGQDAAKSPRAGLRGGETLGPDEYYRYQIEEMMGIDFDTEVSRADRKVFMTATHDMIKTPLADRLFGRRRLDETASATDDVVAATDDAAAAATTVDDAASLTDEKFPSPMPTMGSVGYPIPTGRLDTRISGNWGLGPEDMVWKNQLIDDENMGFKSSASQAGWYNAKNEKSCNRTAYKSWAQKTVASIVMEDGSSLGVTRETIQNFWGFASVFWLDEAVPLKRGVAMMKGARYCRLAMTQLKYDMAGSHGMIKTEFVRDVMCNPMCTESDILHEFALEVSGCTCDELSTPEESWAWHEEMDFCQRNSARMMCKEFDFCGTWECPMEDFMCPRYEFEGQKSRLRSMGCSAALSSKPLNALLSVACALLMMVWMKCGIYEP